MPGAPKDHPIEWDAASYHRLADPQFEWGLKVLGRLTLRGDEVVMDAGCGSGRLTEVLLERLPRGRVIAVDQSTQMLDEAKKTLARFGERVRYVAADLERIEIDEPVHIVFSTATFHWIHDHDTLFRHLYACLIPGGRLHAQCGGGPNLARIHARAAGLLAEAPYRERFAGWHDPWNFQSDATSRERLERTGFTGVRTELERAPTIIADRERYKAFLQTVILRTHVARIGDAALVQQFIERMADQGAGDEPSFSLDYVRLNLEARRPG